MEAGLLAVMPDPLRAVPVVPGVLRNVVPAAAPLRRVLVVVVATTMHPVPHVDAGSTMPVVGVGAVPPGMGRVAVMEPVPVVQAGPPPVLQVVAPAAVDRMPQVPLVEQVAVMLQVVVPTVHLVEQVPFVLEVVVPPMMQMAAVQPMPVMDAVPVMPATQRRTDLCAGCGAERMPSVRMVTAPHASREPGFGRSGPVIAAVVVTPRHGTPPRYLRVYGAKSSRASARIASGSCPDRPSTGSSCFTAIEAAMYMHASTRSAGTVE